MIQYRKIVKVIAAVCLAAVFVSCSKAEKVVSDGVERIPEAQGLPETESASVEKIVEVVPVNPDYVKLQAVYDMMSNRFKGDIVFTDEQRDEFLEELKIVLNDEKMYRQDDLPLFYLIDKKHNVGSDYVPKDLVPLVENSVYNISRNDLSLRPDVEKALRTLSQAYTAETGKKLLVSSTYRSYSYQERLFQRWVDIDGLEEAERESARAGTSQHQLGSAIDFGSIDDSFIETKMGIWLNENSMNYGWSLSFPQEYEDVTGYRWECWHFRYIGIPACRLQAKWFNNVQQYMIEFIDAWKNYSE